MYTLDHLLKRPRRNRSSAAIRDLVRETALHPNDFVQPLFIKEDNGGDEPIPSLPGIQRLTLEGMLREVDSLLRSGMRSVALFPVVAKEKKDASGSEALNPNKLTCRALKELKKRFPEVCAITDVALDPYTIHGHDGLLDEEGEILNDPTVEVLAKMACLLAEAGADIVAPSDMMDGRIEAIRKELDRHRLHNTLILSYAAKYASSLYGPFRDALGSTPSRGDKKSYQMDPGNAREALRECALDEMEGADILMIKPATFYLDIISRVKASSHLPVAAYHVSGEYAMICAAGQNGWLNAEQVLYENLLSIKRAGADIILSYASKLLFTK